MALGILIGIVGYFVLPWLRYSTEHRSLRLTSAFTRNYPTIIPTSVLIVNAWFLFIIDESVFGVVLVTTQAFFVTVSLYDTTCARSAVVMKRAYLFIFMESCILIMLIRHDVAMSGYVVDFKAENSGAGFLITKLCACLNILF